MAIALNIDFDDITPVSIKIERGVKISPSLMYNYFIFNLKK